MKSYDHRLPGCPAGRGEVMQNSNWYWLRHSEKEQEDKEPVFAYFRRTVEVLIRPEQLWVKISADSRYKLYVNGSFLEAGPSKGNAAVWYYDEIDLAPYLECGANVLSVIILHYPVEHGKGNSSIFRTATPGLYFETPGTGSTDKEMDNGMIWGTWECRQEQKIRIISENPYFAPLQIYEETEGHAEVFGWMRRKDRATDWESARAYAEGEVTDVLRPDNLHKRTIPYLPRVKKQLTGVAKDLPTESEKTAWERFLKDKGEIRIPANTCICVELNAGELETGFLSLQMAEGKGARITILLSESYAGQIRVREGDPYNSLPEKGDRTNTELQLYGHTDTYVAHGLGTSEQPEVYEPFWIRTFCFIRLIIETAKVPLTLTGLTYEETGYPLEVRSHVDVSQQMDIPWYIYLETALRRVN